MFFTTSETEGEVVHAKLVYPPPTHTHSYSLLTFQRRLFCCGSLLPSLGVRLSVTFHLTCVHIIFSSVSVAEWSPIGK